MQFLNFILNLSKRKLLLDRIVTDILAVYLFYPIILFFAFFPYFFLCLFKKQGKKKGGGIYLTWPHLKEEQTDTVNLPTVLGNHGILSEVKV